jgi:hypothetical protein
MRKIQPFKDFNKNLHKVSNYVTDIVNRGGKFASDVWEATKVEGEETKISVKILSKMLKGEEVSEKEKKFLKAQSGDIVRILPLVAISGIPIPIPITPLLIMLGKKYGFDFLPKDNREILKNQIVLPKKLQEILIELPEAGMGYHIVDVRLNNGTVLKSKKILNSSILILDDIETINPDDIDTLTPTVT